MLYEVITIQDQPLHDLLPQPDSAADNYPYCLVKPLCRDIGVGISNYAQFQKCQTFVDIRLV